MRADHGDRTRVLGIDLDRLGGGSARVLPSGSASARCQRAPKREQAASACGRPIR
jgi:hypothetical protein